MSATLLQRMRVDGVEIMVVI
jgi:hypothetical protein